MTVPIAFTPAGASSDQASAQPEGHGQRAFPRVSALLHWVTATLILVLFCSGVLMKQIGDGWVADGLYTFHKTVGASILVLVGVRLCWRLVAHLTGRWRRGAGSRFVHGLLYAGLFVVPLLGLAGISDYGARQIYFGLALPQIWPEGAGYSGLLFKSHAWLAFAMIALVGVHIALAVGDYIHRGGNRALTTGDIAPQQKTPFPAAVDMR